MADDFSLKDHQGNSSFVIDGDTEYNNETGKRERLAGVNARETAKVSKDKYGEDVFEAPELGSAAQREAYKKIVEQGGFNYKVNTGKYDSNGREIIERYDADGNSLSETLIATGIVRPDIYTSPEAIQAREDYLLREQLTGKPGDFSEIANDVEQAREITGLAFKQTALNEAVYNPDIHSGVAFRDHNRTLDNKGIGILGQMGDAWDAGWVGVREGMYGYLEGIGVMTGSEMLEGIGAQGTMRAREELRNAPEGILDYREVDGLLTGFQYVMNNAAMSAPYMVTTFGAMAAAVPATMIGGPLAGAITFGLPNSFIYGGHAWNEMEGEKGAEQFAVATTVGVAAAVLDRFGLSKLFSPTQLLSKAGVKKVAKELAEKRGVSEVAAESALRKATREEQKAAINMLGSLTPDDLARFSGSQLGKRAMAGAAMESATEIAQEGLQYGAAVGFSDKEYNSDQLFNRLVNAGIAGGVLGGGLSAAANVYTQGKQEVYRQGKAPGDQDRYRTMNQAKMNKLQRDGNVESIEENIEIKDAQQNRSQQARAAITPEEKDRAVVGNLTESQLTEITSGSSVNAIQSELDTLEQALTNAEKRGANTSRIKAAIENKKAELAQAKQLQTQAIAEVTRRSEGEKPLTSDEVASIRERIRLAELERPSDVKGVFNNESQKHISKVRGAKNFITNLVDLSDFASKVGTGLKRLFQAAERSAIEMSKLVKDASLLDIFARVGQLTTGVYHAGKNFKQFADELLSEFKMYVDENYIAKRLFNKTMNASNVIKASAEIRAFASNEGVTNGSVFQQYIAWLQIKETGVPWIEFYKPSGKQKAYTEERAQILYEASMQIKTSYDIIIARINKELLLEDPAAEPFSVSPDFWWQNRGFDWHKVRKNKAKFKAWLRANGFDETQAEILYQNIAYRGQANFVENYSHVNGNTFLPPFLLSKLIELNGVDGFADNSVVNGGFASENIFEQLNKAQVEAAKYISITKYFGHGGRKLDFLISEAIRNNADNDPNDPNAITREDIEQFAFYMKAIIDSTHGNFNAIEQPQWAAINRFLTSWSIFAGLPLSTISSIPETAMIYYGLQDDADWKMANKQLITQLAGAWDKATAEEVKRTANLVDRVGIPMNRNTIIDRLATGERDVAFIKAHETFFTYIGIKNFTQFQRRMNAGLAIDFIKSRTSILVNAPLKPVLYSAIKQKNQDDFDFLNSIDEIEVEEGKLGFDFDEMNAEELEAWNALNDLGIDVERMVEIMRDTDELYRDQIFNPTNTKIKDNDYMLPPSPKQAAVLSAFQNSRDNRGTESDQELIAKAQELENEINEQLETAVYRFVNERIQNPQAANRPLFFQDPHYQLLTQFNGFISTFTAVVIPKLWNQYLRKGNPQVKYNTFALIVIMISLGGASQYIKDLLKFGKPSPYLDTTGYAQRAVYASGVIGQYERLADVVSPLYPSRDDWLMSTILGEAGPTVRNIQTLGSAIGLGMQGEGERAISKGLGTAPLIAPVTSVRKGIAQGLTGTNPFENTTVGNIAGEVADSAENLARKLFN
jgi:hypothetical protein